MPELKKNLQRRSTDGHLKVFVNTRLFQKTRIRKNRSCLSIAGVILNHLLYSGMADVIKSHFRKKPGFICLDCCWAQQIENADKFVGLTDYFIASPDEMPALGLGYTQLCKQFLHRPTIKAREVANLLVSIFYCTNYADYDSDVPEFRKMGVSLTSLLLADFQVI